MRVLVIVLLGYGSNDNRLRASSIFIRYWYLQSTNFLNLSEKKSVIVSPVITAHFLRKKGKIKTVSILTRHHVSLVP